MSVTCAVCCRAGGDSQPGGGAEGGDRQSQERADVSGGQEERSHQQTGPGQLSLCVCVCVSFGRFAV